MNLKKRLLPSMLLPLLLSACILDGDPFASSDETTGNDNTDSDLELLQTDFHEFVLPPVDPRNGAVVPVNAGNELIIPNGVLTYDDEEEDHTFKLQVSEWQERALIWSTTTPQTSTTDGTLVTRQYFTLGAEGWGEVITTTDATIYSADDNENLFEAHMGATIRWRIADKDGYVLTGRDMDRVIPSWIWSEDYEFVNANSKYYEVEKRPLKDYYVIEDAGTLINGQALYRFQKLNDFGNPGVNITSLGVSNSMLGLPDEVDVLVRQMGYFGGFVILNLQIGETPYIAFTDFTFTPLALTSTYALTAHEQVLSMIEVSTPTLDGAMTIRQMLNLPDWVTPFIVQTDAVSGSEGYYFGKRYDGDTGKIFQFFNDAAATEVKQAFRDWRVLEYQKEHQFD